MIPNRFCLLLAAALVAPAPLARGATPKPIALWPGKAPGETQEFGEEKDMTKPTENLIAGKPFIHLANR